MLLRPKTLLTLVALGARLCSFPVPARASCNTIYQYVTGKPSLELELHQDADGTNRLTFLTHHSLLGQLGNSLFTALHGPLKLYDLADKVKNLMQDQNKSLPYFIRVANAFDLDLRYDQTSFDAIPRSGSLLIVANHPLAGFDALAVAAMISRFRTDIKIVSDQSARDMFPGIEDHGILVSTNRSPEGKQTNLERIEQMKSQIREGGALMIFPSGNISRTTWASPFTPTDLKWRTGILKLIDAVPGTNILPIYVDEVPSSLYLFLSRINGAFSRSVIPSEVAKAALKPVKLIIGGAFPASDVKGTTDEERLRHVREKVFLLK